MSIWAQIEDDRITAIPPDGRTTVDVYANFVFGISSVPDGTKINFLVGKGNVPESVTTVEDLKTSIVPITGVELFDDVGVVETHFVRDSDGSLQPLHVAKVTLKPISDILKDSVTIVAYSTFDKIGTAKRLAAAGISLTVSGGDGVFVSSVEMYDPSGNVWTDKAPMPTGRSGLFCEAVSGKIYAVGGFNGNFTGVTEEYDPALDQWETKESMAIARGFGSSAVVGGKIYILGGYNFDPNRSTDVVECYDPVLDTWTTMSPMPYALAFSTACVVGTDIWVFYGGEKFDEAEKPKTFGNGVLKYDTVGDAWTIEDVVLSSPATTSLLADAAIGDFTLSIGSGTGLQAQGFVTIDRGGANEETVKYNSFQDGILLLASALTIAHLTGEAVVDASLPTTRLSANCYYDGTSSVKIFNGFDSGVVESLETFDVLTNASAASLVEPNLPRYKAGQSQIGTTAYIIGGSAVDKSDYLGQVETVDVSTDVFAGPTGLTKMSIFRTSFGCATDGTYIFAIGGQGSGHSAGWLKMEATATPEDIKADGRQTASIVVTATDASGDIPPDGLLFKVRGLLYISKAQTQASQEEDTVQSIDGSATTVTEERNPPPTISILPVLFSSQEMTMTSGEAATVLLDRSEDFVNEVENLLSFAKGNEKVPSQEALKKAATSFDNQTMTIGEKRDLYNVAIEITVEDDFYFGQTDSEAAAGEVPDESLSSSSFSFNPPSAKQGRSASVGFYSDIASIPDVEKVTTEPVDLATLLEHIDSIREELPFGASPHYDALVAGAQARIVPDPELPLLPPTNIMVSASDNENSGSENSAANVVEEVNLVDGVGEFPVFVTTVVVTDPLSLAARKARTDVADLELISSETGGNSFSLDRPEYVTFIIDRIKTSAPASIGAGSITVQHQIVGAVSLLRFTVSNMVTGNTAALTARYSLDGYNFLDLGVLLEAAVGAGSQTVSYSLSAPVKAAIVEYTVAMTSKNFDSPVLESVSIQYIEPNIQHLFTYPQTVSGQISELAAVTNERLPDGSTVKVGLAHGVTTEFDRDYQNESQPAIEQRGTIMAVNRSIGTLLDDGIFRDLLKSDDGLIYLSKSGGWVQDAITRIFVNEIEALPADFIAVPEDGKVVFRKRLDASDIVAIEVENPTSFRVGLKIENPTLQTGVLDSFAFMYGETDLTTGLRPNRPPIATNLFISPSPVFAGGPLTANYTFIDSDGDEEDKDLTQIIWFRNGSPITSLANKRAISNTDLIATRVDASKNNLISRGQEWFFTIRPNDGKSFGPLAVSPSIKIGNQPPTAALARLISSNTEDPLKFTSSDSITVDFDFADLDIDSSAGSIVTFFVNGVIVKTGSEVTLTATEEDDLGDRIISAGKTIRAEVTPSDGTDFGDTITTETITVSTSASVVTDVSVLPTQPTAASTIILSYKFVSIDKSTDQSLIAWFANDSRQTDFDNVPQIPRGNLKPGQKWYAIVTPFDGSVESTPVKSNVVLVQN